MTAIYYPHTKRLTYWAGDVRTGKFFQAHSANLDEKGARAFLREHIIRTEIVQNLEIFAS
jgi:hypothetical protein